MALLDAPVSPPPLSPAIRGKLEALRARIRRYVWTDGVAATVTLLGLGFWITLGIDWFFEPPAAVRAAAMIGLAAGVVGLIYVLIVRRLAVPLGDGNMAMLLERRFPQFQESLLTAVELSRRTPGDDWNPQLLEASLQQAARHVQDVDVARVFNPGPLRLRLAGVVALGLTIALLAAVAPIALQIWAGRMLLLSDELWPRQTHLLVDGFQDGVVKVARGSDLEVVAKAEMGRGRVVPKVVHVRFRTAGGGTQRHAMTRTGTADPAKTRYQEYGYTFRNLAAPVTFDVLGGDNAVRNLWIQVVDSPNIQMVLRYQFPAYIDRPPREVPVSGTMQLPVGTQVTVVATANKDLQKVQIELAGDETAAPATTLELPENDRRHFEHTLPRLDQDTALLFTLLDTDGIRSREPVRLALAAVPDEAPRLAAQLQGVGPSITPRARLPITGQVTDDYGLNRLWFEYIIDQRPPAEQLIATPQPHTTDYRLDAVLEVEPLDLKPGKKLLLAVKGSDRRDTGGGPNVGSSERWILEIVTPEQLRSLLEARELVLRQRFEAILREVTETRDLLIRVDVNAPAAKTPQESSSRRTADSNAFAAAEGKSPADSPPARELDDDARPAAGDAERAETLRALRVERALQNSRKNAQEVLGVADSFEEIRLQLINNRIDTEELLLRVKGGIADPLRRIGDEMFPELDRRLERLRSALHHEQGLPEARTAARQQADAILLAMRQVLNRMLELESFNEALDLLRSIIEQQEQLNAQTRERHKQKLRDLLKE